MKTEKRIFLVWTIVIILVSSLSTVSALAGPAEDPPADTSEYPYWRDMLEETDINFFDIQRAFNTYWANRTITRGSGWKPFKRWESYMETRIRPDGSLPTSAELLQEYYDYYGAKGNKRDKEGLWQELGPILLPLNSTSQPNGNGRVNALGFHPQGMNVIFAGTSSGGLWITNNHGSTWSSNTDDLPSLGVSAIAFTHSNPLIVYIGTGDRDHQHASGVGVMKSVDGGISWTLSNTGMGNKKVGDLLLHYSTDSIIIAATSGGIYRSTDAGSSWTKTSNSSNYKDLEFHPNNPNIVYATAGGDFYRSTDNAQSWTKITSGLPSASRSVIGVTADAPNMVYFLMTNTVFVGLYRSSDAGLSFTMRSNSPNIMDYSHLGTGNSGQGNYDLAIAVDPHDSNTVYSGGVNVFKSTDGGVSWIINSHWVGNSAPAVHADCHDLKYNPVNGNLYAANDGGVYYTTDGGSTWIDITSGMGIGQIYKLGQSATVLDKVMTGFQDNGTATYLGTSWETVYGGDGMECAVDHDDATYSYGTLYYGSIFRFYNNSSQGKIAGNNTNGINESGAWITPFVLHETNSATMFVGYKNIWRSTNIKGSSTNSVSWQKISTMGGSNFRAIEQSPANTNILYVSKSNTALYRSDNVNDASPTWTTLTSDLPSSGTVVDMEAHPTNELIVYIIQNRGVYKSADKGVNWTNITGTLPDVPFNTIKYYNNSLEGIYLGTDVGVFYRDVHTQDWISFSNGLPATGSVTELDIFYHPVSNTNDKIRASTFGRGLWESSLYQSMPVAGFQASDTIIPVGCSVDFTDLSSGIPDQWLWTFEGGTPAGATQQHPTGIAYNSAGQYYVKLRVANATGTDTTIKLAWITVSDTLLPKVNFTVNTNSVCADPGIVELSDSSLHCPLSYHWEFTPASVSFINGTDASSEKPVVKFTTKGHYDVKLTVTNSSGDASISRPDYILVGGYEPTFTEDFEADGFNTKYWTVENPDGQIAWEILNTNGTQPGNKAAGVQLYNTNTLGEFDRLISPPLNLENMNDVFLGFDHAYAQYEVAYSDSLNIYISDDCGLSWQNLTRIGEDGSGTFATHPPLTKSFVPLTSDDWCGEGFGADCKVFDISAWAGLYDIKIMFEARSFISNNIYLDNIEVSTQLGVEAVDAGSGFEIYPNPSGGEFFIRHKTFRGEMNVSVYNLLGIEAFNEYANYETASQYRLDLSSLPDGIYLVRINQQPQSAKLIIRH